MGRKHFKRTHNWFASWFSNSTQFLLEGYICEREIEIRLIGGLLFFFGHTKMKLVQIYIEECSSSSIVLYSI